MVPTLKYKQQRSVSSMEWRPFYATELAVGCATGVLIWTIDPVSVVARPSAGCVSLLQSPGHAPVNKVHWQPNGELLMTASALDAAVILWNTASETKTPLKRIGGGFHLISWSPNGRNLFAASTSLVFRIWSTRRWTQQKWNVCSGFISSVCWSTDGSTLLYTTSNESQIFCLKFQAESFNGNDEDDVTSTGAAVPVMDLAKIIYNDDKTGDEVM